ncbi:hypothetical protein BD560DRAFT_389237 [Blakeslea trispora]|nr:hypothetical protein BD560DRAFT_389237 [Blakeslea trispora]
MSSLLLHTYAPIETNRITMSVSEYEAFIQREPEIRGIKWLFHQQLHYGNSPTNKYRPKTDKLWTRYYRCHRYGSYKKRPGSGAIRPVQRASKKIGCSGSLEVTCFIKDPTTVSIQYKGHHNHVPGSADDVKYLPLSAAVQLEIEERLRGGQDRKEIRVALNKHFTELAAVSSSASMHRDQFVHRNDVYNIFRRIEKAKH